MIRSVLVLAKMDRPSPMYLIMEEGKSLVLVGWRESVLNYLKLVGVPGFVVCIVHISVLHRAMLTLNVLIRFPCCFRCRCFTSVQCFSLVLFDSRLSTPIHAHSFWLPVTLVQAGETYGCCLWMRCRMWMWPWMYQQNISTRPTV